MPSDVPSIIGFWKAERLARFHEHIPLGHGLVTPYRASIAVKSKRACEIVRGALEQCDGVEIVEQAPLKAWFDLADSENGVLVLESDYFEPGFDAKDVFDHLEGLQGISKALLLTSPGIETKLFENKFAFVHQWPRDAASIADVVVQLFTYPHLLWTAEDQKFCHRLEKVQTTVGRTTPNEIVVSDPGISSEAHFDVVFKELGQVYVRDKGSLNGTTLLNQKLSRGRFYRLLDHDILSAGDVDFEFRNMPLSEAIENTTYVRNIEADQPEDKTAFFSSSLAPLNKGKHSNEPIDTSQPTNKTVASSSLSPLSTRKPANEATESILRELILDVSARFVPIDPNPYIVGAPLREQQKHMFFGRENEITSIRYAIRKESGGTIFMVHGDRRSGKTSLLHQLAAERNHGDLLYLIVDLHLLARVTKEEEFFDNIWDYVPEHIRQMAGEPDLPEGTNHRIAFLRKLEQLTRLSRKKCVFLFDEAEELDAKMGTGGVGADLVTFLASLMDGEPFVSFIFTSGLTFAREPSAFWRLVQPKWRSMRIGFLEYADARRLIAEPVAGQLAFQAPADNVIARLSGGHPLLTQLLCMNLVQYANHHFKRDITDADVWKVAHAVVRDRPGYLDYVWGQMSDEEKVVCVYIAQCIRNVGQVVPRSEVLSPDLGPDGYAHWPTPTRLDYALNELVDRQILSLAVGADSRYQFKAHLLVPWIARYHPRSDLRKIQTQK